MNTLVTSAEITLLYDAQDFMLKRYEKSSKSILKSNMKMHIRAGVGKSTLLLLGMSGYLAILLIGAVRIYTGQMTFGGLTSSFELRGGVIMGAMMFINSLSSIKISQAGIKRINETLNM